MGHPDPTPGPRYHVVTPERLTPLLGQLGRDPASSSNNSLSEDRAATFAKALGSELSEVGDLLLGSPELLASTITNN